MAEDDSNEFSITKTSDKNDEEEIDNETAALSQELAGKPLSPNWIADSSASSHITDQLRLFSGPLITIKRRTIMVGGGRLYLDQCRTARLQAQDGNKALLSSVLFVLNLGVNLVSSRKIYQSGLVGKFDSDALIFEDKDGNEVIKASHYGGVYIVSEIVSGLNETALSTTNCCLHATDNSTYCVAFLSKEISYEEPGEKDTNST